MIKELQNKTDLEIGELISKLKIQLLEMRFKIENGEVSDLHKFKEIRKFIAVAMTVLSKRKVKVSFSTHSIQLIKTVDNKQVINSINNINLISSLVENHQNKEKSTTSKSTAKKITKTKVVDKKEISKDSESFKKAKPSSNAKHASKEKKPKINATKNTKSSVQIRKSAKG